MQGKQAADNYTIAPVAGNGAEGRPDGRPLYAFAADVLIRFKAGRILIHTTSSGMPAFESDQPMLVGWLCQFCKPMDLAAALSSLQLADRTAVSPVIDYLVRSGALVEAASPAATVADEAHTAAQTRQHLRLLARSFYDTAADLLAFGAYAEQELARRTGAGVERRLMALLAAVDGLRSELRALRPAFVDSQLKRLAALGMGPPAKLHIGCGEGLLPDWINIDIAPAPLSLNVQWGLPFADSSIEFVYVSHLLEHLFFPRDVQPFLAEIRRVLKPGGVVRIVVPDIEKCIAAYVENDREFFASRRETWPWWPENPTRLEDFLAYAGAGPEPAYLFESHKYGYDLETLTRALQGAKLGDVVRSEYMSSGHEALRVDAVSAVAKAQYGERYYSLFVEATRGA